MFKNDKNLNARLLQIRLVPKASANKIVETSALPDGSELIVVHVTALPEGGKANAAMLEVLSKHLKIPLSKLKILQGAKARRKVVMVRV